MACSSEAAPAAVSMATATSASGMLRVSARTVDDAPPVRGANAFDVEIVRVADGGAVEGVALAVTPWMPAMGHGTSTRPVVSELGGGHHLVEGVNLFMPGLWELRVSLTGSVRDDAAPRFQIR